MSDSQPGAGKAISWVVFLVLVIVASSIGYLLLTSEPDGGNRRSGGDQNNSRRGNGRANDFGSELNRLREKLPKVVFDEVALDRGIDFRHENGAEGSKLLPETMGSGCAFIDYDNDGDQDLLLINSGKRSQQSFLGDSPGCLLYANDGFGHFEDVTSQAELTQPIDGTGVAVGDFDNDGWDDVFVAAVGKNHLYQNLGDGRFVDVTDRLGLGGDDGAWSTSCGWFDYDNDGDLDLFVCNYLDWSFALDESAPFRFATGERAYGRPQSFGGADPYLYRNEGDGTFRSIASEVGIVSRSRGSKALGVTFADIDGNGWLDIYVANDTTPNQLFLNQQGLFFDEYAGLQGVALSNQSKATGAMGVDVGPIGRKGDQAVVVGNFTNETTSLYVKQDDELTYTDRAQEFGVATDTLSKVTFGVFFVDYDLDGRLDIFATNGHLEPDIERVVPGETYRQPSQLYWNTGSPDGPFRFLRATRELTGPKLFQSIVGRGASYSDIDADGDLDFCVSEVGGAPRLFLNGLDLGHNWIRFQLIGVKGNRNAIGAKVIVRANGETIERTVMPTRSYQSQVELPVTIGLGKNESVQEVVIEWPDGQSQTVSEFTLNKTNIVVEAN